MKLTVGSSPVAVITNEFEFFLNRSKKRNFKFNNQSSRKSNIANIIEHKSKQENIN